MSSHNSLMIDSVSSVEGADNIVMPMGQFKQMKNDVNLRYSCTHTHEEEEKNPSLEENDEEESSDDDGERYSSKSDNDSDVDEEVQRINTSKAIEKQKLVIPLLNFGFLSGGDSTGGKNVTTHNLNSENHTKQVSNVRRPPSRISLVHQKSSIKQPKTSSLVTRPSSTIQQRSERSKTPGQSIRTPKGRESFDATPTKTINSAPAENKFLRKSPSRPLSAPLSRSVQSPSKPLISLKESLEAQGMKLQPDHPNLNLDNFNQFNQNQRIVLTSPRSIEACMNLGVSAKELIYRPEENFCARGVADNIVKMRWAHNEQKRKEKLLSVRKERQRLMDDQENNRFMETKDNSTSIARELEEISRLDKSLQQSVSSFEALLNAEILKKKRELEGQKKLEEAQKREERLRNEKEQEAKKIEYVRHKRHMETLELQKRLKEKHQSDIEKRKAELEMKDQYVEQKIRATQERQQQFIEELKKSNEEKSRQFFQAEEMKKQKSLALKQKLKEVEQKKLEFEENRKKMLRESIQTKSQIKEERLLAAKRKAESHVQEKVNRILDSHEELERKKRELEEKKRDEAAKQKEQEQIKESRRKSSIQKAQMEQEKRIEEIRNKRETNDKICQELLFQKQKAFEKRMEEQKLKKSDRLENIERLKRVETFKRLQLMSEIEEKVNREDQKQDRSVLYERRMSHKLLVQRAKKIIDSLNFDVIDEAQMKQLVLTQLEKEGISPAEWETVKLSSMSGDTGHSRYWASPVNKRASMNLTNDLSLTSINSPASPSSKPKSPTFRSPV